MMRFLANENFPLDAVEALRNAGHPAPCGVVLFRFQAASSAVLAARVLAAIGTRTDWPGHFAVVTLGRIRMRELPMRGTP